jgi:hypothetical protein
MKTSEYRARTEDPGPLKPGERSACLWPNDVTALSSRTPFCLSVDCMPCTAPCKAALAKKHQAEAHVGCRFGVDDRCLATEHHVDQLRRLEATGHRLEIIEAIGSLDESDVRSM